MRNRIDRYPDCEGTIRAIGIMIVLFIGIMTYMCCFM